MDKQVITKSEESTITWEVLLEDNGLDFEYNRAHLDDRVNLANLISISEPISPEDLERLEDGWIDYACPSSYQKHRQILEGYRIAILKATQWYDFEHDIPGEPASVFHSGLCTPSRDAVT